MERTGVVVSTQKAGSQTVIILKGLPEVREGQHLRCGDCVWTIVKKHWVRKPHIAVILNQVRGGTPIPKVDQLLELEYDQSEGETLAAAAIDLTVETVVRFEKQTMICARGVLIVSSGDVVYYGEQAWKVLESSGGAPALPGKTWISIKAEKGTHVDPLPNTRLLKR